MRRVATAILVLCLAAGLAPAALAQGVTVAIGRPAQDETVHDNQGNVSVLVGVEPTLAPGNQVVLLVDGRSVGRQNGPVFALTSIDRGTHTLQAQVLDANGNMLATSAPVTFHMWRAFRRP
jgi:hypothetical protein